MRLYAKTEQLPAPEQVQNWIATLQQLKQEMQPYVISLSLDENVMPRTFYAAHFTQVIGGGGHQGFSTLVAVHSEVGEMMGDTLMTLGIDAMTYTKVVHDSLRSANLMNPIFDEALRELDEFNKSAQAEEVEEANEAPVKE